MGLSFPRLSDIVYYRMDEKTRSSVSKEAFNGITDYLENHLFYEEEESRRLLHHYPIRRELLQPRIRLVRDDSEGETRVVEELPRVWTARLGGTMGSTSNNTPSTLLACSQADIWQRRGWRTGIVGPSGRNQGDGAPMNEDGTPIMDSGPYRRYRGIRMATVLKVVPRRSLWVLREIRGAPGL